MSADRDPKPTAGMQSKVFAELHDGVRLLYHGSSRRSQWFRYGLLALDLLTVAYIVATTFTDDRGITAIVDPLLGCVLLTDFLLRLWVDRRPLTLLANPLSLAEVAAIVSFLMPVFGGAAGFLRALRVLRILHSYQLLRRLRLDLPVFRRHEELLTAALHLVIFLFVMTELIYVTQSGTNDQINNFVDALYFAVTALTTTGYGDITLQGTSGRLFSVAIMIFGVTLFLRLAQVLFRPSKIRQECETCGLQRHEPDAIHCKHCGELVHLDTEGDP